ncbi:MAG: GEVED domain-containing protein, partial [Sphingomonadales bacterium]
MYSNYAGVVSAPVVNPGQTINWSVNVGTCNGWYGVNLRIYFDWNLNGSFADAGENPVNISAINGVNSGTVTIPTGATVGTVRMRVIATEGTVPGPTGTYTWGETEDYCVQVAAAVNCSGAPNNGVAAISTASGCPNASFILSTTNFTFGTGISYQWQSAPTATGPWTNITGATSTTLTTSTATTTFYRLNTTCLFSATSSQSNVVSYTAAGGGCQCGSYPAVFASSTFDEEISNVTVGTMNNSSNCTTTAPGPGSINARYSNYTGSVVGPSVNQGDVV